MGIATAHNARKAREERVLSAEQFADLLADQNGNRHARRAAAGKIRRYFKHMMKWFPAAKDRVNDLFVNSTL